MYNKILSLLLTAALLIGCNISDDRRVEGTSSSVSSDVPSVAEPAVITGRAVKGVIEYARVALYPFLSPDPLAGNAIATALTDQDGRFTLEVPSEYLGLPVYVHLSASSDGPSPSSMTCDIPSGCDGVSFGFPFALEDLTLSAIVPVLQRRSKINISLLTHLAAESALQAFPSAGEMSGLDYAQIRMIVGQANSGVASQLGVIGDITTLPLVDLVSSSEVQEASHRSLWYAAVNAGVLEAAQQREDYLGVTDTVTRLAGSEFELPYAEILKGAQDTLTQVQVEFAEVDLTEVLAQLSSSRGLARGDERGLPQPGVGSATAALTSVGKAKALVKGISQVTASVNLQQLVSLANISSLVDPQASAALDQFGFELSAAQIFEGRRAEFLTDSMSRILYVILETFETYYSGGTVPGDLRGISFVHEVEKFGIGEDVHTFQFHQPFSVCEELTADCIVQPDLEIQVEANGVSGNQQSNFIRANSLGLLFDGQLNVDGMRISFLSERQRITMVNPVFQNRAENEETTHVTFQADAVDLVLPVQAVYNAGDNEDLQLEAEVAVSFEEIAVEVLSTETRQNVGENVEVRSYLYANLPTLSGFSGDFYMTIANQRGDSLLASVALKQTKNAVREPISYVNSSVVVCPVGSVAEDLSNCEAKEESDEPESGINGETEDNFLSLVGSVGFKANLRGISSPVLMEVFGARVGPKDNRIDELTLRYPGQALRMSGTFGERGGVPYMTSIEAVNLDGVELQMVSDDSQQRSGHIKSSLNEQIAEIVDMGQWIKVVYSDGEFQSLCRGC